MDDTPLEAVPAASWDALGGCPEGRDSCPDAPGLDPIRKFLARGCLGGGMRSADVRADNYMDYTSDECRTEFTAGQVAYAHGEMEEYRGVVV